MKFLAPWILIVVAAYEVLAALHHVVSPIPGASAAVHVFVPLGLVLSSAIFFYVAFKYLTLRTQEGITQ